MALLIGAIADDSTGFSDLSNMLACEGMNVVQGDRYSRRDTEIGGAEAVVIALKSRTAPMKEAVDQSVTAYAWLKAKGVEQTIFKYCSAFDSTVEGNIGPVADALRDATLAMGAGWLLSEASVGQRSALQV